MSAGHRTPVGSAIIPLFVGAAMLAGLPASRALGVGASTHAASCRDSRLPPRSGKPGEEAPHLRLDVDVDGDGLADVLEVTGSEGSRAASTDVELTLGGSAIRLEASEEFAFTAMTAINPIPKELLEPRHRDALAWIEESLFDRICTTPDPSLAWLLDPKKRLTWTQGPPRIPTHYAIRLPARSLAGPLRVAPVPPVSGGELDPDGEVWLFYAGGVHADKDMRELARDGDRVLLGTAHGVILTNPRRSRHAWIYVYPGGLDVRLRFPSIAGARLVGETAIIRLQGSQDDPGDPTAGRGTSKPREVRVNLNTGAISK